MTKLADEACDLFKGTPKSQHQNELEQRIKCETKAQLDLQTEYCGFGIEHCIFKSKAIIFKF